MVDDAIIDEEVPTGDELIVGEPIDDLEEYAPSYTYKVKDEERSFDERLQPFVKDQESEDYLRDLYTKADGLEGYKTKVGDYESALQESNERNQQLSSGYEALRGFKSKGDYRQLFKSMGIDDKAVLEYAYGVAKEDELPEEQQVHLRQNRDYQDRLSHLENEANVHRQQEQDHVVQRDLNELEHHVNTNKVLNDKMATSGFNLRDEVLSYGIATTKLTGKEPSIQEATNAVVAKFGKMFPTDSESVENIINNRPNALPKINGSNGTAPTKRYSLADLRAMANKIH